MHRRTGRGAASPPQIVGQTWPVGQYLLHSQTKLAYYKNKQENIGGPKYMLYNSRKNFVTPPTPNIKVIINCNTFKKIFVVTPPPPPPIFTQLHQHLYRRTWQVYAYGRGDWARIYFSTNTKLTKMLPGPPRGGGGGKLPWAPTLIGSQLESKCLKLSRFFKLVRAFLELRAPYCSSTCSVAKVYFRDPQRRFKLREALDAPDRPSNILVANAEPSNWQNNKHHVCVHIQGIHFALSLGK